MSKKTLLIALFLYLISAGGVYAGMRVMNRATGVDNTPTTAEEGGSNELALLNIDPKEPKNQPCPLNGALFTNTERLAWEKRRPLYVMIENTPDARPQSGLSDADIVFEAVAEGGITRFGAMFYCQVQIADTILAPIRSARTYFVDWASGFNLPLYVHVGGANEPGPTDALGQIANYGWNNQNDMNQFSIGYPTFVRDFNRIPGKEIATEHTMVTSTEKLWAVASKRGWTNMSPSRKISGKTVGGSDWKEGYKGWTFEDGKASQGSATAINYDFWSGYQDYAVSWQYDAASNTYKRSEAGSPHLDMNDQSQIAASNVVILYTKETGPINDKKHMLYGTTGTGKALIFKNGQAVEATWSKKDREAELQFLDAKGNPFSFTRGMVWISVLATGDTVTY